MKILFTCSSGGHLTELLQLKKIIIQNKSYLLTETNQLHNNLIEKVFKVQQINRKEKHFLFYFVKLFLKSRKIYILGMRSSFTVAQYLAFYLNVILDNVQLIRIDMGDPYQQIVRMNEEDILIVFSFPRYSKQSHQVAKYAKSKGAYIVSITDSSFAPVAPLSDNILLAKSNMASFVDSLVAAMSVANALIISVAMKETDDIKKYFHDLEQIWEEYVVYE